MDFICRDTFVFNNLKWFCPELSRMPLSWCYSQNKQIVLRAINAFNPVIPSQTYTNKVNVILQVIWYMENLLNLFRAREIDVVATQ